MGASSCEFGLLSVAECFPGLLCLAGLQVAEEIWVVGDNTVSKWRGTIEEYKEHLKATHAALVDKPEMTER